MSATTPPELRPGAIVQLGEADSLSADVVIIGTGMGGGTLAWAIRNEGLDVLLVERGDFLPREPENGQPEQMHVKKRYRTAEPWIDSATGTSFDPGVYYWVGGNTKMYGACLPRFRRSDFEEVQHHDGVSPSWPFSYDDLEPHYGEAEHLFQVHGQVGEDLSEPPHTKPYPYPALAHEPTIERLAESLRAQGLHPFHMPNAINLDTEQDRRAETASDGAPSPTGAKSDAENRAVRPALESANVRLLTNAYVRQLHPDAPGGRVVAAEAIVNGRSVRISARTFVVSAGAVNSAALLLRSSTDRHPHGLANSSGLVGRRYMVHNSTFLIGVDPRRRNRTAWQKTLGLNDWYERGPDGGPPLGNLQMLGKLQAPMVKGARPWVPSWALKMVTDRSIDCYLTTEDLPQFDNRIRTDGTSISVSWTPNNLTPHTRLVRQVSRALRRAGYPIILTERMSIATNSHQCGLAVAGHDPRSSVLDVQCRAHDLENLFVVDSSFFPSSAALNPALTIAANALRVAPAVAHSAGQA